MTASNSGYGAGDGGDWDPSGPSQPGPLAAVLTWLSTPATAPRGARLPVSRQRPPRHILAVRTALHSASPVASAILPAAPSRRRSRRVSPAGSRIVMVPLGPVILIRPVPARSAVPPALRTAATSSRAALLRQRSGIYRDVLSCLAFALARLPLAFSARIWGAPHWPAPHRISRPPEQRGHLRKVQVNTAPRTSPVPRHARWRLRGCSRSDAYQAADSPTMARIRPVTPQAAREISRIPARIQGNRDLRMRCGCLRRRPAAGRGPSAPRQARPS